MRFTKMGILAAAVAGLLWGVSSTRASSIEITGTGGPTADGTGGFNWTYQLTLTAGNSIAPSGDAVNNSIDGSLGSVVVFYDIGGYKGAGFAVSAGGTWSGVFTTGTL